MNKFQYNRHPFDMSEYLSGERFVVGGLNCDWEEDEKPEAPVVTVVKAESSDKKLRKEKVIQRKSPSISIIPE